jgi:hypothetical protein
MLYYFIKSIGYVSLFFKSFNEILATDPDESFLNIKECRINPVFLLITTFQQYSGIAIFPFIFRFPYIAPT